MAHTDDAQAQEDAETIVARADPAILAGCLRIGRELAATPKDGDIGKDGEPVETGVVAAYDALTGFISDARAVFGLDPIQRYDA